MSQEQPLTWAEVDLAAIAHNVREVKRWLGPDIHLLPIVKANAYGHGAVEVARAVLKAGADALGVARVEEGVQLRMARVHAPILIMGHTPIWEAEEVVAHALTPTVNNLELAQELSRIAERRMVSLPVQIKVDTGLIRYGSLPDEAIELAQALHDVANLNLEGVYTHFACGEDEDPNYTREQLQRFQAVVHTLRSRGIEFRFQHAGHVTNVGMPDLQLNMVRIGLAVYGLSPAPNMAAEMELRPAMSLKSRLVRIASIPAGQSVGYARTFEAGRDSRIGTVPIGYGDGLDWRLQNKGCALIRGQRVPMVGRVSMDNITIDLTDVEAELDDEVLLLGCQGGEGITAEEIAALSGTISYDVPCSITARVPRVYVGEA
ncbi:MAG TPA: alanine racemase [Chloroflexota bacterium]|nr:alanine racemase [Chloroflexota bacterium]